jgi:hypothetical protein
MPDLASLTAMLPRNAGPYIWMVLAGFAVGILGHLSSSRRLIAAGVILICLGALLLPLVVNLTQDAPSQIENAR